MLFSWLSRRLANPQLHSRRPETRCLRRLSIEPLESRQLLSTLPAGFQETTVALGVNPTGFDFAPDGRMFVAEKHGQVSVFQPDGTRSPDPFFSVAVDEYRDRGLTAVLIDPNFAENHFVYVYYTAAVPNKPNVAENGAANKLIRLTASASNPNVADPASQVVLLDGILSPAGIHQGGFLEFGADGMLYVGVGDADSPTNSQTLSNLYGKVLRLDVHGSQSVIPSDNPFVGQTGKRPEIWAYGFRNPFSGAGQPGSAQIYVNDVGGATWEEINRLQKGGNYGWPLAEGTSANTSFVNPIYVYSHGGGGAAIVGGAFSAGTAFPATYTGQYFTADLVQGLIRATDVASGATSIFASNLSYPTDVDFGPDGSLYWSQIAPFGALYKISFMGGQNRAPTARSTADVTSGAVPLTVNFDGSASSDPDGDPLTYAWNFGDGTTGTGVKVQHIYSQQGAYQAVLTVSDRPTGGLTSIATPIVVTAGNRAPLPTITAPLVTDRYSAGQTIQFAGVASDFEDGDLPASAYHWSFQFGHNTHFHDFIGPIDGATSGSFTIDRIGEVDPDQYYRITLTVTDSEGLSNSTSADIRPLTSTFTVNSNIGGVKLFLDGQPITSGTTVQGVVGMLRTLKAPAMPLVGGIMYRFTGWSDGGAAEHTIQTPAQPTTYTARYEAMPLAALYSSNVPQQISPGQLLSYKVTITNVGTKTWLAKGGSRVQLGVYFGGVSDAVGDWVQAPVIVGLTKNLAPGKSATLNVRITAPVTAGNYVLRHRMLQEPSTWFDTMERIDTTVVSLVSALAADVPTVWSVGQPQQYAITITNNGTATWKATGKDRVRLGVYFGGAGDKPKTGSVAPKLVKLPHDLPPGESVAINLKLMAPTAVGKYVLRHRLTQDRAGWFSDILRTSVSVRR